MQAIMQALWWRRGAGSRNVSLQGLCTRNDAALPCACGVEAPMRPQVEQALQNFLSMMLLKVPGARPPAPA